MMKSSIIIVGLSMCVCALSWRRDSINSYAPYCEARGTPRKLVQAPCDIEKNVYCTEPGNVYPRRAVRQFVSDNQGLMKRMYGDLRHLSVLRSEMEWNSEREQSFTIQRPNSVDDLESNTTVTDGTSGTLDSNNSTSSNESSLTSRNQSEDSGWTTTSEKSPTEKGINACPTRQEVVAPYWAVNTRGRTLAIVNDPPYEQHIHWEKCLHENEQMLCRDGCRCEQQYRLQRLLAYDPTCDCKGVFMDWFLLPSCCVCKCYGLVYDTGENQNVSSGRRRGRNDEQTSKEIKVSSSNHSDINAENEYDVDYDV